MLKKVRDTGFFSVMCSADGATTNAEKCGQDFGYTLICISVICSRISAD